MRGALNARADDLPITRKLPSASTSRISSPDRAVDRPWLPKGRTLVMSGAGVSRVLPSAAIAITVHATEPSSPPGTGAENATVRPSGARRTSRAPGIGQRWSRRGRVAGSNAASTPRASGEASRVSTVAASTSAPERSPSRRASSACASWATPRLSSDLASAATACFSASVARSRWAAVRSTPTAVATVTPTIAAAVARITPREVAQARRASSASE